MKFLPSLSYISISISKTLIVGGASFALVACGGSDDPNNPIPDERQNAIQIVSISEIEPSEQCLHGGHEVKAGLDLNSNSELDADEVLSTRYVCDEPPAETPDPLFALGATYDLLEDQSKIGQLAYANGEGNVTFSVGLEPLNGSVVVETNGEFTYTPNANFNGQDVFSFVIESNIGERDEGIVQLLVEALNDAPVVNVTNISIAQPQTLNYQLAAVDPDGDNLEFNYIGGGDNGVVSLTDDGSLSYQPADLFMGTEAIYYEVTDGESVIESLINIQVLGSLQAQPFTIVVQEDSSVTSQLADRYRLNNVEFSISVGPVRGSVELSESGAYTYSPNANEYGQDLFEYVVRDRDGNEDSATVQVSITPENDSPIATDIEISIMQPQTLSYQFAVVDEDNSGLRYEIINQPSNGIASMSDEGLLTYQPFDMFSGTDSIGYRVNDGQLASEANITIQVQGGLQAQPFFIHVQEDSEVEARLLDRYGLEGVEFSISSAPNKGSLELATSGEYTYRPNLNEFGQDTFLYIARDSEGNEDESRVIVNVAAVNDAPSIDVINLQVVQGNTLRYQLVGSDADGDSLEYALIASGELGATSISQAGELVYASEQHVSGEDTIEFSITDGSVTTLSSVTISVLANASGLVTSPTSFVVQEDSAYAGQLTSENGVGNTQYYSLMPALNGDVVVNADGSFTYTPATHFYGQDLFSYYAVDEIGASNISQVSIAVTERNRAPVAIAMSVDTFALNAVTAQLEAFDTNGDDLVYSLNGGSALADVTLSESGLFSYTPNQPYTGLDTLTYSVTDGELTAEAQITVSVTESAIRFESPVRELQAQLEQRQTLEGTIRLTNLASEAITVSQSSLPSWYISEQQFEVPANGEYEVTYTLSAINTAVTTYTDRIYFRTNEVGSIQFDYDLRLEVSADVTPPAMITDLSMTPGSLYDELTLSWTAVGDSGNAGGAARSYDVRMSDAQISEANWDEATPIMVNRTPGQPGVLEQLNVSGLDANSTYYLAVRTEDHASLLSTISNVVTHTTPQLPIPELAPASAAVELQEGESDVVNITLTNTGGSPLEFNSSVQVSEPLPALPIPMGVVEFFAPAKRVMPMINGKAIAASTGNIIVKMNPGVASMRMFGNTLSSMQLKTEKSFDKLGLSIVSTSNKTNDEVANLVNQLNSLPEVAYAEPDYLVSIDALPDDAMFDQQWALNNEGQTGGAMDADIDAPESWDRYTNGANVIVAVIDTGVKYDHEDLASNMWVNEGEIPGNGVDDDANGFIDDVHGYDFVNNDGDPMDDNQHGTHCAGIIGADTNNGVGIAGTAHNAQIMAVKFLSGSGGGNTSDAIQSVLYAVDNGATILSNSWGGGGFSQALMDAIQYAHDHDVMFIAAAGNSNRNTDASPNYPSGYDVANVLSVASTTHTDGRSSFSNYGATTVDLGAPGTDILSTIHTGGYASLSGTSMATPYVSGAAVLIRSNFPHLSAQDVKEILMSTVDPISALAGITVTGGRLNVESAINEASSNGFIIVTENASGVIAAGESVTVPVSINALGKAGGLYENSVTFNTNNPEQATLVFDLDVTVAPDEIAPEPVSDLSVLEQTSSTITLEWTNTGDDGLDGQAQSIYVAYSDEPITETNWQDAMLIENISAGISGELQQLLVADLLPDRQYFFAMKVVDNMGLDSGLSNNAETATLLGPVISLTPEAIPVVELAPDELATETLEIANEGDETLSYRLIYEPVDAVDSQAKLNTEDKSLNLIKGEKDYRQGEPAALASGGPDVFGYRWDDSDGSSVIYDWTDITATGTAMSFSDDSVTSAIDLGFTFDFYGVEYTQVRVSSNGFLTFADSTNHGCCSGQPIPSSDTVNNIIAWAWRDLHPKEGSGHYLIEADKVTFQFTDFGEFSAGGGTITAQVIIYANGIIKLQYHSFTETFRSSAVSVGIENSDGTDGLQVVFNNEYLHSELAVAFSTLPSWLTLGQIGGAIGVGSDHDVINFNYDATGLLNGTYEANILVESNDLTTPLITIPLRLDVVTPAL